MFRFFACGATLLPNSFHANCPCKICLCVICTPIWFSLFFIIQICFIASNLCFVVVFGQFYFILFVLLISVLYSDFHHCIYVKVVVYLVEIFVWFIFLASTLFLLIRMLHFISVHWIVCECGLIRSFLCRLKFCFLDLQSPPLCSSIFRF